MLHRFLHYCDKLEDRIRIRLSRYPIIYSIIGGVGVVLFWRGVWITADQVAAIMPEGYIWIDGPISIGVSLFMLLATGLFVSFFINDTIILSGVKRDKKLAEKTETEVRQEALEVDLIQHELKIMEKEVKEIHDSMPISNHNHH